MNVNTEDRVLNQINLTSVVELVMSCVKRAVDIFDPGIYIRQRSRTVLRIFHRLGFLTVPRSRLQLPAFPRDIVRIEL